MFKKIAGYFQSLVSKLLNLHDAPHSLAGGVAIGMFMGFTPFFGLKTLLCIGAAYVFRCNPIAAVIAVSLHDVVTPFGLFFWRSSMPLALAFLVSFLGFHILSR